MLRIINIVMSKTYVQKALILNGFFMLAQPPGERECTIAHTSITTHTYYHSHLQVYLTTHECDVVILFSKVADHAVIQLW